MSGPADDDRPLQEQVDELNQRVTAIQADIDELEGRADAAHARADQSETRADAAEVRADQSETRADDAEKRADKQEARADANHLRIDDLERRVDVDQEMIAELQAEGVLSREHAQQMEEALRSSRRIGAAMGLVMASRNVNEEVAFTILARASQRSNRKLRDIADDIVRDPDVTPRVLDA